MMKMPVIVRELSKKEIEKFEKGKIKPHVTLEKGERPWTSHYFEARDDTHPNNKNKNFIYLPREDPFLQGGDESGNTFGGGCPKIA